jgi:hypothetical protein
LCPVSVSSSSSSSTSEQCGFYRIGQRKREKELGKCSSVERRKKELLRTYRIAICLVVVDAWYFTVVTEAASSRVKVQFLLHSSIDAVSYQFFF